MMTYRQYFILRCILVAIFVLMAIVFAIGAADAEIQPYAAAVNVHEDSGLWCREGPGAQTQPLWMFASGAKVLVLEERDGWAQVAWPKFPEKVLGWVCLDYLK